MSGSQRRAIRSWRWPIRRRADRRRFRSRALFGWNRAFADRPEDARFVDGSRVDDGVRRPRKVGTMLRPIATPLADVWTQASVAESIGSLLRDQRLPSGGRARRRSCGRHARSTVPSSQAMRSV